MKEKEMTWKLDVTNSCLLMIHYAHVLSMNFILFFIQDLHIYTGKWFCYLSKILTYYGNFYTSAHTLVVCLLKYIFIVHWKTAIAVGHEKIKEVFFWANLLHPIFMLSLHFLIRPDFLFVYDAYRETDICLGDPKGNLDPARNKSLTKLHNLCELVHPTSESLVEISIYWIRSSVCWVQFVFFYFVLWNF